MLTAHIEPLTSILRIFPDGAKYGDEYIWCCTLRWVTLNKVELCGVIDFPCLEFRHVIGAALWKLDIRYVFFVRKTERGDRVVEFDLIRMAKREGWL